MSTFARIRLDSRLGGGLWTIVFGLGLGLALAYLALSTIAGRRAPVAAG